MTDKEKGRSLPYVIQVVRSKIPVFTYDYPMSLLIEHLRSDHRDDDWVGFSPNYLKAIRKVGTFVESAPLGVCPSAEHLKSLHRVKE